MVWVTLNDRLFKQLLHPSMHTSGCHTTLISELKPKFLQLLFFIGWAVSLTQRRRCIPIGPCIASPHTLCVLTNNNTITKNKAVSHTNTLFFSLNCQISAAVRRNDWQLCECFQGHGLEWIQEYRINLLDVSVRFNTGINIFPALHHFPSTIWKVVVWYQISFCPGMRIRMAKQFRQWTHTSVKDSDLGN